MIRCDPLPIRDTEILIQHYENVGLKLIDLKIFIIGLKITWLRRLVQSESKCKKKKLFEIVYIKLDK